MSDRTKLDEERSQFALLLARLSLNNWDKVLWFDETTYNSFTCLKRSWSTRKDPNLHPRAKRRWNTTVYGTIGLPLGERNKYHYVKLGTSTERVQFLQYCKELKAKLPYRFQHEKPILVLDNHPAHRGAALEVLSKDFVVLYLPAYSCEFNSVEKLWSASKVRF